MATGVKPRDEETHLTRSDLEAIQDAMKSKKFRELLSEYCEEVRNPANQELYQKEMTQLEKERGYDVTFINPKSGYVIKTSVAGDRKAFINVCSNDNVGKPSYIIEEVNGQRGMNWKIPYSLIPPREDFDLKRERAVIYDVVFHPDTLRMAEVNKKFRELVNKTALDGLQQSFNIHLDSNNMRFPKSHYKGMTVSAVIRKEDPNYKPPNDEECNELAHDVLEKLYPQHIYKDKPEDSLKKNGTLLHLRQPKESNEYKHLSEDGYTTPKYIVKQQKKIDLQEFTNSKDSKQYSAIPSHIIVEVNLPLLSSTEDCVLDVRENSISFISEKPAKYKLNITLPYYVNEECGNAKFDKSKHILIVDLPVLKRDYSSSSSKSKVDSGLESEEYSGSQSDEDFSKTSRVVELSTENLSNSVPSCDGKSFEENKEFLDNSLGYILPAYTYNVLDDVVAFTFHVKHTEPDSVKILKIKNKICIKFTTMGSGFVPVHYAALLIFDENINFVNATGEAWDNNVILQLEVVGDFPQKVQIGLQEKSMVYEYFDMTEVKNLSKDINEIQEYLKTEVLPVVEVTNFGLETSIVVSSNPGDYDEDDVQKPSPINEKGIVDFVNCDNSTKSILRKPITMTRSFSESSYGDVASSMDYISSDCIPEESSLKKTVRFNEVIAKQFYRYNSSIEGQKKKNQRKKSKKRNLERRKSESEAEDDTINLVKTTKPKLRPALKQRRDSGLADTSDAEVENKSIDSQIHHSNHYNETSEFIRNDVYNEFAARSVLNVVHNNLDTVECIENPDDNVFNGTDLNLKRDNQQHKEGTSERSSMSNNNTILNIVDNKDETLPILESTIWKSEANDSKSVQHKINTKSSKSPTCDSIKHNTDLYNPENLNKGQYLEVAFKNDLIFDLDM